MNLRKQILESELRTVKVYRLTPDEDLARAAKERENELRVELNRIEPGRDRSPPAPSFVRE